MEKSEINALMIQFANKIPLNKSLILRDKLEKSTEDAKIYLSSIYLYNPVVVIFLSLFLGYFAIDRFYIDDIEVGVVKLLLGWLTLGIWSFIDIFLCYKKAKEKNFEKIISVIS